jgi:mycothiol synthase
VTGPELALTRTGTPDAGERAVVVAFLDRTQAAGRPALGGPARAALEQGGGPGFEAVLARSGTGELVGYAQVGRTGDRFAVEVVVGGDDRTRALPRGEALLGAALEAVAAQGGGPVTLWAPEADATTDALAGWAGLGAERDLHQMRCRLPLERSAPPLPVRAFRPGRDEEAWLAANNRAFAGHPEQGAWELGTLLAREAEPWFDAGGFLLHERHGRLAGSCWTKIHDQADPPLGEIYVISVDPDFQGLGLGRALTVAGLDHLAGRGIGVGMLYVDAANRAAVALYLDLGFTRHHVDRAYTGLVSGGRWSPPAPRPRT